MCGWLVFICAVLFLFGRAMAANTADEDKAADYFDQKWLERDQRLLCYACDFRYELSPDRDSPLYCPRCGLPLVTEDEA